MPVPTVTYRQLLKPCAAPRAYSLSAAALTSVSISTGTRNAERSWGSKGKLRHRVLGVVVI